MKTGPPPKGREGGEEASGMSLLSLEGAERQIQR